MTPLLFVGLAVAGGIGAALRFVVDGVITARVRGGFPVGTVLINVSGSLLLGLITGLGTAGLAAEEWRLIFGTGLLGGFTTFSTASFQSVKLLTGRRPTAAALNAVGTLVASVLAAALGLGLGLWLGTAIAH